MATKLSTTGHENRLSRNLAVYGLSADISISDVDVGLKQKHPVLRVADALQTLAAVGKFEGQFLMGHSSSAFEAFWDRFKLLQPEHPVFANHASCTGSCVPICLHFDEGTTLKKKSIMVVSVQPLLGKGTRKRKSSDAEPGCNMLGDSLLTRLLYSVMLGRVYNSRKAKGKPLSLLVKNLSLELRDAFFNGVELAVGDDVRKYFLVPIAVKGDWPALAKVGQLTRHFGRQAQQKPGHGICHLCLADKDGYKDWHNLSYDRMLQMRVDAPMPWHQEPDLLSAVPIQESHKPNFFRIDLFHTLHKGLFADLCANAIAFWTSWCANPCNFFVA